MKQELFKPFFINTNMVDSNKNLKTPKKLWSSISANTGNSYITYALLKTCGGNLTINNHIPCIYTYDFNKSDADIDYINNQATHVFLGLQDQIRVQEFYNWQLPYKQIQNFIEKLNKPIIIAGLGANSFEGYNPNFHKLLSNELKEFLKCLSEHCVEIGVRGYYTQEILSKLGINNVCVIGCPSYFERGKYRVIKKWELSNTEQILLTSSNYLNILKNNHQILQDIAEEKYVNPIAFDSFNSDYTREEIKNICDKKYHIFTNMESWKKFVSNFRFAIGYRLHGAIVSINAGTPALCANPDSRAREMCEYLKIPYHSEINEETDLIKLYNELDIDGLNKAYPVLYENYCKFLKKNNVPFNKDKRNIKIEKYSPNIVLYKPACRLKAMLKYGKFIADDIQYKIDRIIVRLKVLYMLVKH